MDTIQWPTRGDIERAIQEDEEMVNLRMRQREVETESEISEEAYKLTSPATTRSMSLCPVSPSEVDRASISTRETTPGPDENAVPLPVVRGVIQSASRVRPGPYSVPASTRQLHVDPTIICHYLTLGGRASGNRWEHVRNIEGRGPIYLACNHQSQFKCSHHVSLCFIWVSSLF